MNVLLRHFVDFLFQGFIDAFKVFEVFILVCHAPCQQGFLVFNFTDELVVVNLIQRVPAHLFWPVSEHALKLVLVVLADVLSFFELARDFKKFLHELGVRDLNSADADFATNF